MYYLNSRYYDANMGRFINADKLSTTVSQSDDLLSANLFAYCTNNPVNNTDETGNWKLPNWAKIAIGVGVIATCVALSVATAGAATPLACFAAGALEGAICGAAIGAVSGATISAVVHRAATVSWKGAGKAAIDGAADGFMWGTIGGAVTGGIGRLASNACFVAGTRVLTAAGTIPIEEIKTGDLVYSEDPETGKTGLKRVVRTYVHETYELVHVHVGNEEIKTTREHPFWVIKKGWVGAGELKPGDILKLESGKAQPVQSISVEKLGTPVAVYNFEVADWHTYFVGNNNILVHNTCGEITGYTKHGLNQVIGRDGGKGVSTKAILDTIKNPSKIVKQEGGKIKYMGNKAVVVLNKFGKVVTAYAKSRKYWR
ncbi:polymorphic toxin-type HINT domain-containing protein [Ethanoligenens sp.]|uniref:polymorphic toxin-type HINT domain-containing protein n=1 Tax=Ethanoligenens sp. TaxID=2099655 RepID=UPI0039EAC09A